MDQYLSTVIIALITGTFSLITLVIQKKQDKVIKRIDDQTLFIEKEKELKQKLTRKEKERESVVHEMMILILDTNLNILKNTQIGDSTLNDDVFRISTELKEKFSKISGEIEDITKEYEIVLDMTSEFQKEIEKNRSKT